MGAVPPRRRPPSGARAPGLATPTCTPPSTASPAWPTPRPSTTRRPPPRSASSAVPGPSSPPTASPGSGGSSPTTGRAAAPRPSPRITFLASRHQRIRPYTPRHNGKVERYNRILAEECLYARPYSSQQQRRDAVVVWSHHDNDHRPHTTCGNQAPATCVPAHVTNVMTSYTWVRVSPYPVGVLACFNDWEGVDWGERRLTQTNSWFHVKPEACCCC